MKAPSTLEILAAFDALAAGGALTASCAPGGLEGAVRSFCFRGPAGGGDAVRIGIFAGIHGDEPAGCLAAVEFARWLAANPAFAKGYQLFFYPVCNPSGLDRGCRLSKNGRDLNREFWKESAETEVRFLEGEIRGKSFHGLISLHADDTSEGLYGFVRGAVLTRALLEPALRAAERILPRNRCSLIDGFPAADGIIGECYEGILTSPPDLGAGLVPFELILETPNGAPLELQASAFVTALRAVLEEYQKFLAFAADL